MIKRVAVGFVLMLLVVAAVGLGLIAASRLRGPTEEQTAALALLAAPPHLQGSNAYPALLLMGYDVPEAKVEALALSESERFNRTPIGTFGFEVEVPYAIAVTASADTGYCGWRDDDCLEKVRGNRDAIARQLAGQQALLQRIASLSRHGHSRSLMDPRIDATFPKFHVLNASITHHALQYIDGDVGSALAGVCGDVHAWRRLAPNADSVIASMMGATIMEGSTLLLAEMLEPLPADHPLPAVCAAAFAPPAPSELSLCQAMRGEAAMSRSAGDLVKSQVQEQSAMQRAGLRLFYDQDMTAARLAPHYARACSAEVLEQIRQDVPAMPAARPRQRGWGLECAGNAAGCILADIAAPAYNDYPLRMQDAGMALRTMGTLLWIRTQRAAGDSRTMAELVANQPAALASASRPVEVVEDGAALQVARFKARQQKTLELPLPVAVRDATLADEG